MAQTETRSTLSYFVKALLIIATLLLVALLPSHAVFAQEIDGVNYEDNDYNKIVAFLNQPSATANTTNAVALGYTVDDPSTWKAIAWTSAAPKRVSEINFNNSYKKLSGGLDVSNFACLTNLFIRSNEISSLNISGCVKLASLDCSKNKLTKLNVANNANLISIACADNKLATLDVSKNTNLETLYCNNNKLTKFNVTSNIKLKTLDCHNNQLTTLNVAKNTKLESLNCGKNKLAKLNVTNNTRLRTLDCYKNRLTELNVTKNSKLSIFTCENNKLKSLDVTKNTALHTFICSSNQLTKLDLSKHKRLYSVACNNNKLKTLDITKTTDGLFILEASNNPLTKISVKKQKHTKSGRKPFINKIIVKGNGTISHVWDSKFEVEPARGKKVVWTENGKQVSTKKKLDLTNKLKNSNLVVTFK